MKYLLILALLSISTPAIAQVNRTVGNGFSDLGEITARSNQLLLGYVAKRAVTL
jgi:hypothetical protein